MNTLSIHQVRKIEIREVRNLKEIEPKGIKPSYSIAIEIYHDIGYVNNKGTNRIEITLFSDDKEVLELIKLKKR
jgi:hypothetical protein